MCESCTKTERDLREAKEDAAERAAEYRKVGEWEQASYQAGWARTWGSRLAGHYREHSQRGGTFDDPMM